MLNDYYNDFSTNMEYQYWSHRLEFKRRDSLLVIKNHLYKLNQQYNAKKNFFFRFNYLHTIFDQAPCSARPRIFHCIKHMTACEFLK